jgi:hypothetical protein
MKKRTKLICLTVAEAANDMSLSDRYALLDGALLAQFGNDGNGYQRFFVQDAFLDYLIARGDDGKLFKITYSIDKNDNVTLGTAQEVETAYVPVAEAGVFVTEAGIDPATLDDCTYPVRLIKAGWSRGVKSPPQKLDVYYPPEFIAKVAEAADGAKFGRRHPTAEGSYQAGENDPQRIAGYFEKPVAAGDSAGAVLKIFESETQLRGQLSSARKAGKLDLFGLSILANVRVKPGVAEGKQCLIAESLGKLFSFDLCSEAGAGGGFISDELRIAAAADVSGEIAAAQNAAVKHGSPVIRPNSGSRTARHEENRMNKTQVLRVIEALRTKDAVSAARFHTQLNEAKDDQVEAIYVQVTEALSAAPAAVVGKTPEQILAEAKQLQFVNVMEAKLTDSKLPEPAKKMVRRYFEGRADSTTEQLDAEIVQVRESFSGMSPVGRVSGISVVVGLDSQEKVQIAMDRMIGVREADASVPAFKRVSDAYKMVTGDHDLSRLSGGAGLWLRASEAIATTDFPNLLLNSMTKKLLQDYAEATIDGLDLVYTPATISDYKLQDRVRDGYFGELPTVAEAAAYAEMAKPTDERVNYAVANRGGLLTISEQTIRNDDLGAIARFPQRLARAGRQTLRTSISNYFINNTAYMADAVNWFDNTHSNLLALPLSQDALIIAQTNLRKQTEKDSGERLNLSLYWLMVPADLEATAIQINQTNTAGNNAFYQRFGANNERIIVNPKLTDANDWYYGAAPSEAPSLEIGFLDGIKQPQIFLANLPTQGTSFTNDQIQYKVKFPYGGAIIDYRGVGKSVNA